MFQRRKKIIDAFREEGLTIPQAYSLVGLYSRELPYQELRGFVGIRNLGQFSNNVIMPLRKKGYIKKTKTPDNRIIITQKGKSFICFLKYYTIITKVFDFYIS